MSAGLNQITILGRLGKDAVTNDTHTETTVTHFDVAVDESYKNKAGTKIEKATWFRCEAWNIHLLQIQGQNTGSRRATTLGYGL